MSSSNDPAAQGTSGPGDLDSASPTSPGGKEVPTQREGPRKRRRWRLVLLAVCALLVLAALLVAALPTLLSTGPGRSLVLGQVNRLLLGRVELDRLSLGWFAGAQLEGLRVFDAQNRLAVTAAGLRTQLTVWNVLLGRLDLGEVTLESPNLVLLEFDADGRTNLERMVASTSDEPIVLPSVAARVRVTNFTATIQGPPVGPPIRIDPSELSAETTDLANAPVRLNARLAFRRDGVPTIGRLDVGGEVHAVFNGRIDISRLAATLDVRGEQLPLALAGPVLQAADLRADGTLAADLKVSAAGLQTASLGGSVRLADLDLSGAALRGDRIRASRVEIPMAVEVRTDQAGARRIEVRRLGVESDLLGLRMSATVSEMAAQRLGRLEPAGDHGRLDLELNVPEAAKLLGMLPNLLSTNPDLRWTGGSVRLKLEGSWGENTVGVTTAAFITDVAGTRGGQVVTLEPVTLSAKVTATLGQAPSAAAGASLPTPRSATGALSELNIGEFSFTSAFGSARAAGTLADLTGELRFDLGKLQAQASQFFDLPLAQMTGRLIAQVSLRGDLTSADAPLLARLRASATGVGWAFRGEGRPSAEPLHVGTVNLELAGELLPGGGSRVAEARVQQLSLTAGDGGPPLVSLEATADVSLLTGDVASFDVQRLDLSSIELARRRYAPLLGAAGAAAWNGLSVPGGAARLTVAGRYVDGRLTTTRPLDAQIAGLSIQRDGRAVLAGETLRLRAGIDLSTRSGLELALSGLSLSTQSGLLAVEQVGDVLQVRLPATDQVNGRIVGRGQLKVSADLAGLAKAWSAFTGTPQDASLRLASGRLGADVSLAVPADGPATGRLIADLAGLTVGDRLRGQSAKVVLDARSADGFSTVDVSADVSSPVVSVELRDARVRTDAGHVLEALPSGRLTLRSDDLAQLDALLAPFLLADGSDVPRLTSGTLNVQVNVVRRDNTLQAELVRLAASELALRRGGAAYRVPESVSLTGQLSVTTTPDGRLEQLDVAALDGSLGVAKLTVRQPIRVTGLTTDRPSFAGAIDVSGRLHTVLGLVETLQGQPPGSTYPYVGEFALSQQVATQAATTTAVGSLRLSGLQLLDRNGRAVFSEDRVELTNDLTYVASGAAARGGSGAGSAGGAAGGSGGATTDELRLREFSLRFSSSQALAVSAVGTIRDLAGTRSLVEPLRVTVAYDLARLITLVQPLLDEPTRKQLEGIDIAGRHESRFELMGSYPSEAVSDVPVRSLGLTGGVRLDRAVLPSYGVELRNMDARIALREGLLVVTLPSPADLNDGKLNLTGVSLDFNRTTPRLNVPKGQVLVDGVALNRVVADRLGRFFGPLFVNTERASGKLRIRSEGIDQLPLGDLLTATTPDNDGRAEIVVSIENLELVGGFAGDFVRAIPVIGSFFIGNVPEARFIIQRGVVAQDLPIIVGSQVTGEMRFTGNIELAEPQRLNPLQVRIGSNLLRDRIPLVRDVARLADPVFVIRGTVRQPRLDLVAGIQQWIRDQAGGILPGLLGR